MLADHERPQTHFCLPENDLPKVVVIGSGFAGLNFIKSLRGQPVQIILIDQHNFHQFQPLLYQVAISGLEPDSVVSPVRKLFKSQDNMIYRMAKVAHIDTDAKKVQTNIGQVHYDYLVIATGSSTNFYGSKNIEQYSIGLKSINDAINIRSWMLQNLEKAVDGCNLKEKSKLTTFVVVGGGPAGVEMAGALAEFKKYLLTNDYPEIPCDGMRIILVQASNKILPAMSEKSSAHGLKCLKNLGVEVIFNGRVKDYDGEQITVNMKEQEDDLIIKSNNMIWTAGVKGNLIDGISPEAIVGGRLKVNKYSQVAGYESVFAIGDIAAMITEEKPRGHPMVAQVAIQQGKTLSKNIISKIKNGNFITNFEYKDKGSMATIGKKNAVADLNVGYLQGRTGWLLWSFVHLISITGFKNRYRVALNWIMKYFTYDKTNQLIIRKYNRE